MCACIVWVVRCVCMVCAYVSVQAHEYRREGCGGHSSALCLPGSPVCPAAHVRPSTHHQPLPQQQWGRAAVSQGPWVWGGCPGSVCPGSRSWKGYFLCDPCPQGACSGLGRQPPHPAALLDQHLDPLPCWWLGLCLYWDGVLGTWGTGPQQQAPPPPPGAVTWMAEAGLAHWPASGPRDSQVGIPTQGLLVGSHGQRADLASPFPPATLPGIWVGSLNSFCLASGLQEETVPAGRGGEWGWRHRPPPAPCREASLLRKPWGQPRQLGPDWSFPSWALHKPCRPLGLWRPCSPASSSEGPSTPLAVGAAWVEQGGGGQGSGQAHCLEEKELTSAPGAGPPTPPGFLPLGCQSGLCPPYLGIEKPHCVCGSGSHSTEPRTHRVEGSFATSP